MPVFIAGLKNLLNQSSVMSSPRWVPLESNPDVMNNFIASLGVSGPYSLQDVLGFDPELLGLVPKPVVGLIFLYPIKDADNAPSHDVHEKVE